MTRHSPSSTWRFPASTLTHLKRRYFRNDPGFFGGRAPEPAAFTVGSPERRALAAAAAELARSPSDLAGLERFLLNLIHDLARHSPRTALAGCAPWLQEACERFRQPEHLAGGVQALARLAGRSPEHVSRQLRACAGLRPVDVVTEARIEHAASRLALGDEPIVDIALECGFDSLSHFYRVFRRVTGETPAGLPTPQPGRDPLTRRLAGARTPSRPLAFRSVPPALAGR